MGEISRILGSADDDGQTAILEFLFTAIRRANPRQIEQFADAEIMDPVSAVICTPTSKNSNCQLAVKVINTLVKKSAKQRDRNDEALKRFQFVSNQSLCDHLPTGSDSRRQSKNDAK
uniref:Uncharacterized protein n=1 Tax=Panagrolaimus sp. JU765 TaxID=591449 RepID=A0AC34RKD4_9BILA